MNNHHEISITTGTFVRGLLVIIAAALIFLVRDILLILLVAVVIASAANPAVEFFSRFNFSRTISAGIVYAIGAIIFSLFFYFFAPIIVSEVLGFLTTIPEYSSELSPGVLDSEEVVPGISLEEIIANVRSSLGSFTESFFGTIATIFGGLFNFVLILTISFYLSIQKNGVANFISYAAPVKYTEYALSLWERSQEKISGWFKGMVISSLVVGVSVYIGLLILGVPYAFFFALLSALLNFIPFIGPVLSAIPAAAVAFAEGGLVIGVFTLALFVFIQFLEGNVLYPLIVGRAVGVSPIAIILAIGIGSKLGGFLGVLLAVPFSAVLVEFLVDMRKKSKGNKKDVREEDSEVIEEPLSETS